MISLVFSSEAFRSSPRQADLMIVSGTVSIKTGPRLRLLWEQMPEPKWILSIGKSRQLGWGILRLVFYRRDASIRLSRSMLDVPGRPPRPEALIEGILKLRENIEKKA